MKKLFSILALLTLLLLAGCTERLGLGPLTVASVTDIGENAQGRFIVTVTQAQGNYYHRFEFMTNARYNAGDEIVFARK